MLRTTEEERSWAIIPAQPGWQTITAVHHEDTNNNAVVELSYHDIIAWRIDNDRENGSVEPITASGEENQGWGCFSVVYIIMPPTGWPIVRGDYLPTRDEDKIIEWFNKL